MYEVSNINFKLRSWRRSQTCKEHGYDYEVTDSTTTSVIGDPVGISKQVLDQLRPGQATTPSRMRVGGFNRFGNLRKNKF